MQYLLDTHTFIWLTESDVRLSGNAAREIVNGNNKCFVSIASIWEIAIKSSNGKLLLKVPFPSITNLLLKNNISILPIEFTHLQTLLNLNLFHKDPFDRIIIAQAITEDLTILTVDKDFSLYPVKCLW
jgi:PIN domain nuclease of toxin-antitoxin system